MIINKHDDLKWEEMRSENWTKFFLKICDFLKAISTKIMLTENKLKDELKTEVSFFAKLKIRW